MTHRKYAPADLDDLVELFVAYAKQVGSPFVSGPKPVLPPEQSASAVRELHALGAELCFRNPVAHARTLFEHENPHVRGWAGNVLTSIDEEWANATYRAVLRNMSTREMLAMCRHARKGPPKNPKLKDMTVDQLVERFRDAGVRHYATQFMGGDDEWWDQKLRNRIIGEEMKIVDELKSRDALPSLTPLMDDENSFVRMTAAIACLRLNPDKAVPLLKESAKLSGADAGPTMVLFRWEREKNLRHA